MRSTSHIYIYIAPNIKLLKILICNWDICVSLILYTYSVYHTFHVMNLSISCHCFPGKIFAMLAAKLVLLLRDVARNIKRL